MGPDPKTQAAFVQLDRDGDGALATAELAAAEGLIRRLDVDEDEMVALAELRPNDNPYAGQFGIGDSRTWLRPGRRGQRPARAADDRRGRSGPRGGS